MATTGTSSPLRQIKPSICPITGDITYCHQLTETSKTDRVRMTMPPELHVLPVIFVPGVMGSNLCDKNGNAVWVVNSTPGVGWDLGLMDSGQRQKALHPGRTKVYTGGELPLFGLGALTRAQLKARGWGEISASFYKDLLIWLEKHLNGGGTQSNHAKLNKVLQQVQDGHTWNAAKSFKPLSEEESKNAVRWTYPVHAFGYNWLNDLALEASELGKCIKTIKELYNKSGVCEKVILVTHSMGGLVARYCSEVENTDIGHKPMRDSIAGIVHGAMPTVGAAVAYRRCKVGMWDEDLGTSIAVGTNGREITAVFAQSPGTLQLLPSKQYPVQNWLELRDTDGNLLPAPDQPKTDDPYTSVYTIQDKWWGLVKVEWLNPKGGAPIVWDTFSINILKAKTFHQDLADKYHANTYGFYGSALADLQTRRGIPNSFARVTWIMERGEVPMNKIAPTGAQVMAMNHTAVHQSGSNPVELTTPHGRGGAAHITNYRLRLDDARDSGDGTVSVESGRLPVQSASVKQFFNIPGVTHGDAYNNASSRQIAAYAIGKIAAGLPLPTKGT